MQTFDIADLKRQLAEIDARRAALENLISAAEAYFNTLPAAVIPETTIPAKKPVVASTSSQAAVAFHSGSGKPKTIVEITEDVALELIAQHGRPAQTREVLEVMTARNLPLPSKSHINVVSARLSNSTKLVGRRGLGWWPRGRAWPDEEPEMFANSAPGSPVAENGEAEASPNAEGVAAPSNNGPSHAGNRSEAVQTSEGAREEVMGDGPATT